MEGTHAAAILAVTLLHQLVGIVWYGLLFRAVWQEASGMTDEQGASVGPLVFAVPVVFSVTSSLFFLYVLQRGGDASATSGAVLGVALWALVSAPCVFHHYAFQQKAELAVIDVSKDLVCYAVQGAVLGFAVGRKRQGVASKKR